MWFKCNPAVLETDRCWVPDNTMFPNNLVRDGPIAHAKYCNSVESKTITDTFLILNHPYFFVCFKSFLTLNIIQAIHLNNDKYCWTNPGQVLTRS